MTSEQIAGLGRGTYILLLRLPKSKSIQIGKLGSFNFQVGYYAYVGSAFGPGGLTGRLSHHFKISERPHWHIDYLRTHAEIKQVWSEEGETKKEHVWADILARLKDSRLPVPGFGCSDCRCASHLFYFEGSPILDERFRYVNKKV